jgi:hypothetical protein
MSTDNNIAAGTLAGFRFNGKAELKHVNIRKDKANAKAGDDGVLTVDLTILAACDIDLIDYLDPGIRAFLWSTEGIVRNTKIASLKIKSEVADLAADVAGVQFAAARASSFIVEPLDSLKALVKFKLSAQPTASEIAVLAEHHGEEIDLSIRSETAGLSE